MAYNDRLAIYQQIERERDTKLVAFVNSDRVGMETQIAHDCIDIFVDLLDKIGPTKRISLLLHTNGGATLAAWRLVNLIRTFCDELEVIIPLKALSAGTLIAIGSDRLVMTKQAALGPIDPSVNNPLNPQINMGNQLARVPVSVESVLGYLEGAREQGITDQAFLTQIFSGLSQQIHPLVLGEIFRSRAQIRYLAGKLIQRQITDAEKSKSLIDFLCVESGSHDYTINRREATALGLNAEKPSDALYKQIRSIHLDYAAELKLLEPYSQQTVIGVANTAAYQEVRGLIESPGGCYRFISEGNLTKVQVPTQLGPQPGINDVRTFEGWRNL